jgi:hypothetical protein
MTTDSEHMRYRSGYAAGQRDAVDSSDEVETQRRPVTGDDWADMGYAQGFEEGKRALRSKGFAGGISMEALRFPQVVGWMRRVTGHPRDTS